MTAQLFSEQWYRVADLRPRLKPHVTVHRQIHRGSLWYLLKDGVSGRQHRLDARSYQWVARLLGEHTVEELWETLLEQDQEHAPSQHEVITLISQLHQADLVQTDLTPDVEEMFERQKKRQRKQQLALINPLSFRAPLFDPTSLLQRLEPWTRWIFTRGFLLVWIALVSGAIFLASMHWQTLATHARIHFLTPHYWLLLWLVYPTLKALHEIAHGLTLRRFGGEVNEMGISLLALMPVPYVNASSAAALHAKWQRIAVSAAGIMTELFLAALALLLWLHTSDGLVRDIAFITLTIGGLSTVLFNGNPLLKFDGYYILSDLIEIPNLASASKRQWAYLARRYLLRARDIEPVTTDHAEARWLTGYGLAAWLYRWSITFVLAQFFANISLILAAALVCLMLYGLLLKPIIDIVKYLRESGEISQHRLRAWLVVLGIVLIGGSVLLRAPLPYATVAQGIVWLPDEAQIRSTTSGEIREILVNDQEWVTQGQVLLRLDNPLLQAKLAETTAHLAALDAQKNAVFNKELARMVQIDEEIQAAQAERDRLVEELEGLTIRAQTSGRLSMPNPDDLPGSYIVKGSLLGHVIAQDQLRIRAVFPQSVEQLVRHQTRTIEVTIADQPKHADTAFLLRETPASTDQLPSAALSVQGGGPILTDPGDSKHLHTLVPVFTADLEVPGLKTARIGARCWVRFDHGYRSLIEQWSLPWRQLFLQTVTARST